MIDPRYAILFDPIQIGPVTAPNRFSVAPYANGHSYLQPNGAIGIRSMRAEGGWGIVGMQLTEIDPSSDLSGLPYERLWDDGDVKTHARSVEKIHAHGALASIELGHTGLRSRGIENGYPVLGPSNLPTLLPTMPYSSRAMDKADIKAFRSSHKAAILRAKDAGYDIAYVYAAHDASLLWHFLTPHYNHRNDEYGGSLENRARLLREVLEDAQDAAAGQMAIALRFAVHEASGPKRIRFDGEGQDVVAMLADLPDLWDVNVSGWSVDSSTARYEHEGFQESVTSFVKKVTQKPVLGVGRFTTPDTMVNQIKRGVLDIIGSARASIADPFLPTKVKEGRIEDIRECIGCNICVSVEMSGVGVRCTQNPTVSEEWRRNWHPEIIPASPHAQSVLIVGGGPSGLEAALTLTKAGHNVTVAEQSDDLGGRSLHESSIKGLASWRRVRDYRVYQLQQLANVNLYTGSALDADSVAEFSSDVVIIATGSSWVDDGSGRSNILPISGFAGNAMTPTDYFNGADLGKTIAIYDDDHDYMANALAADLAEKGHDVHIISPLPTIGGGLAGTLEQPRMIAELHEAGVHMHPNTTALSWENGALQLIRSDTGQPQPPIIADTLLSVTGRMPDNALSKALTERGIIHRLIGDAEVTGTIQAAVFSGHRHAREILGDEPEDRIFKRERPTLFI